MTLKLSDPIFTDAEASRLWMEAQRWPNGPVCPRCRSKDRITKLQGKSTRPGVYKCNACNQVTSVEPERQEEAARRRPGLARRPRR